MRGGRFRTVWDNISLGHKRTWDALCFKWLDSQRSHASRAVSKCQNHPTICSCGNFFHHVKFPAKLQFYAKQRLNQRSTVKFLFFLAPTLNSCIFVSGTRTTGNPPGLRTHTPSPNSTGAFWLQDWLLSYSSRYECFEFGCLIHRAHVCGIIYTYIIYI